jgi:uncharacterized protein YyaL (SSP411 family)
MNRLARERSPYLLQHAANPVDWYPWCDEAFARARAEDKPIFLSVGYSTCHWCHVMEHESFENTEVAAVLNEQFVAIKVDREERPDIDRVYMTFVQGTTGSGGWPMSVWLTPDLKPFYGGTYYPPSSRWGRPGFIEILREIHRAWTEKRAELERSAVSMTEQLRSATGGSPEQSLPSQEALTRTVQQFRSAFDRRNAGFGGAPKFPRPSELLFLLREHVRTGGADEKEMVLSTLRAMAVGGMRDHIGGGFHRYSVDAAWRVPHFEKMLYDQAQMVLACLEGAEASGDRFHLAVAEDTLQYVMREMTGPDGGFFSAEDADSVPPEHAGEPDAHKMEGAYYLWRAAEVDELLGSSAALVRRRFGILDNGNAPMDPQQEFVGKNLLYIAESIDDLAGEFDLPVEQALDLLNGARIRLFQARLARPHPHLDDKVLTAWNGLMIAAFARAARVLGRAPEEASALHQATAYLDTARKAAHFVRTALWNADSKTLLRRYRDGAAGIAGYAEDYAYLIFGLLELFQSDPRAEWLEWAVALQHRQDELFWDDANGGWFSTTGHDPSVLLRVKEEYDGAEPAAGSVSVFNLMVLSHVHDEPSWRPRLERALRTVSAQLEQAGRAVPMMSAAFSTYVSGLEQIVIVGKGEAADALVREARSEYRPFALILALTPDTQIELASIAPFLAGMHQIDDRPAVYICRDFSCRAPVMTPEALRAELQRTRA